MNSTSPVQPSAGANLIVGVIALVLLVIAGLGIGAFVNQVPNGGLEMVVVLLALIPAILMGFTVSVYQVPYIMAVWAFAPELRRLIDYFYGQYQSITILSLLPLLVTTTLLLPIMRRGGKIETKVWKSLRWYIGALCYGAIVGAARNGSAMLYDLVQYLLPLLVLFYAYQAPMTDANRNMLLRSFSLIAVVVAAYAWFQFLVAPPWDAFWMEKCGMGGIGSPEPLKIRVFSTLNSPGPASMWLSLSLALMLLEKNWRTFLGWIGVVLVASALALTLVRGEWICCAIVVAGYLALSPSEKRLRTVLTLLPILVLAFVVISLLPGGDSVTNRVDSFGNLESDHSLNSRVEFFHAILPQILSDPIGHGLGSIGLATKAGDTTGAGVTFDNGYAAIFVTFGWLGGMAFLFGLLLTALTIWNDPGTSLSNRKRGIVAVSFFIATLYSLSASNSVPGVGGVVLWFVCATVLGFRPPTPAPAAYPTRSPDLLAVNVITDNPA